MDRDNAAVQMQVLTPEQLKEFADFQTQQLNLQKAGAKMARELFGAGKPALAPVYGLLVDMLQRHPEERQAPRQGGPGRAATTITRRAKKI